MSEPVDDTPEPEPDPEELPEPPADWNPPWRRARLVGMSRPPAEVQDLGGWAYDVYAMSRRWQAEQASKSAGEEE